MGALISDRLGDGAGLSPRQTPQDGVATRQILPARAKVWSTRHLAALPYADIPEFMTLLRGREGARAEP